LLRAEIEGETPQTAQIELQVSSGPEYRLDLEIHAEGGSADGGECFTAVVSSSSFNVHDAKLQGVTLAVLSTGARELGLQPVSLRLWAANATSGLPTAPVATAAALTAYVYVTPAVALLNASANASAALQLTFGAAALAAWPALQPGRTYALVLNASASSEIGRAHV
jgi:hypothetical protein